MRGLPLRLCGRDFGSGAVAQPSPSYDPCGVTEGCVVGVEGCPAAFPASPEDLATWQSFGRTSRIVVQGAVFRYPHLSTRELHVLVGLANGALFGED